MVKVSTFISMLHDNAEFQKRNSAFLSAIEKELGQSLVFTDIEDYEADLKLIFVCSGGSEGFFLSDFDKLQAPYLILTSGSDNSLAASLEIMTYLNARNLKGEILHGSAKYIAKRIKELMASPEKLDVVAHDVHRITKTSIDLGGKYGIVGKPSDWLIASVPDYEDVKNLLGTELVDIGLEELVSDYEKQPNEALVKDGLDFGSADKMVRSVVELNDVHELDGIALRCFDLLDRVHTTGCLALATLNSAGMIGSCEGDIMSLLSMAVVRKITDQPSFQANPSRLDPDANTLVLAHCTIPFDMLRSFSYDTHFESGIGVAVKGELQETDVTIFRMSSDLKSYYVAEGRIVQNLSDRDLCRTQIKVELDDCHNIAELLSSPCGNHHIVFYGRHRKEIMEFLGC